MRRASVLLSMLMIVSLLLVACGGQETTTSVPSTNVPPVTADATGTSEDGTGTETETAGPDDTTTTPAVPVTGEDSPNRLSNLLDFAVWNQNGEQIGQVEDMVLDFDNTMVSYVLIGTGGFLDLGDKTLAVPWEMLDLQDDATGGQQNAFMFVGDEEFYRNAPDTDVTTMLPEAGAPAEDWDADIQSFWQSGVAPGTDSGTPAAEGTAASETPAAGDTPAADATASTDASMATATLTTDQGQAQGQGEAQQLQGVMLASDVLSASVMIQGGGQAGQGQATADPNATAAPDATADPNATATTGADQGAGETMTATVEDVILDPQAGELQYLVITGDFGAGETWIPVPFGVLGWDGTNQALVVQVNPASLQNAPAFEGGEFPDMSAAGWNTEIDTFWANPDSGGSGSGSTGGASAGDATATPAQ